MTTADDPILARLKGTFRRVALLVGAKNALKIAAEFGGQYISVPKLDAMHRDRRDRKLFDEYDKARAEKGVVRRLAIKYSLTPARVYQMLQDRKKREVTDDPLKRG
jgi:Mor family transcriptional regulator